MIERFVLANGLQHHVITWGDPNAQKTVVMCHGFLDMGLGFFKLAPELAQAGYRVISLDFRGHGESEWIGRGGYYHFSDYVLDLHALLPQLVKSPFHLVGHSMGGTVCTLYAATHLEDIQTLSLLEGYGPPADTGTVVQRMQGFLASVQAVRQGENRPVLVDLDAAIARLARRNPTLDAESLRFLAEHSTEPHPRAAGLTWRFDPLHRTPSPVGFEAARFAQFTAAIDRPTLIVQGEHGLRTGDDDARIASYPRATKYVLPGAAHMLHWTHARETAQALLGFFAQA